MTELLKQKSNTAKDKKLNKFNKKYRKGSYYSVRETTHALAFLHIRSRYWGIPSCHGLILIDWSYAYYWGFIFNLWLLKHIYYLETYQTYKCRIYSFWGKTLVFIK